MSIFCFEILNDGEGERGRNIAVVRVYGSAREYAEHAAAYFDDIDKRRHGLTDSDLDGGSRVIEVHGYASDPPRFRVCTRVKREYESWPEGGPS